MKHFTTHLSFLALSILGACANPEAGGAPAATRDVHAPRTDLVTPTDKSSLRRDQRLTDKIVYRDGAREVELYIDASSVADFAPSSRSETALLAADPLGREDERTTPRVRLWKVDERLDARSFARGLNESAQGLRFSPVFRESSHRSGARRALPGGVIARFPADWDRARIDAFVAQQAVAIDRELPLGVNTYLVATAPGFAALEAAERLEATGQLESVAPNWWREASAR